MVCAGARKEQLCRKCCLWNTRNARRVGRRRHGWTRMAWRMPIATSWSSERREKTFRVFHKQHFLHSCSFLAPAHTTARLRYHSVQYTEQISPIFVLYTERISTRSTQKQPGSRLATVTGCALLKAGRLIADRKPSHWQEFSFVGVLTLKRQQEPICSTY